MTAATFFLYLGTWTLVAVSPGPAVLYVMSCAAQGGVRGSLPAIAGLQLGSVCFFAAVGTGFATVLATMTTLVTVIRALGALYLVWLGASLLLASRRQSAAPLGARAADRASRKESFCQGLLVQLTNPKALLFASALLPQFLDAHRPLLGQLLLLFAVTFVVDVVSMLMYALLVSRGVHCFRDSWVTVGLKRVFGATLIGLGIGLACAHE